MLSTLSATDILAFSSEVDSSEEGGTVVYLGTSQCDWRSNLRAVFSPVNGFLEG